MTFSGFALVLAAAICHATWNFLLKRVNGGAELVWLFSVLSALMYMPVAVLIWMSLESGFGPLDITFIAGSAMLHLCYFLLLQTGYRTGDLSLVYPIARATGPILATGFAVLFLGEAMSLQIALGATVIIVGVARLSGGRKSPVANPGTSLGFGLAAGTLIGSYTVWDAYAVSALMIPPLLLEYASSLGRVVLLTFVAMRRKAAIGNHWRTHGLAVTAIALFNPLAYILVLYALTFTPVIFVAPTREISVVLAVLAGSILLGEGELCHRLLWALFILSGVALLATA